MTLATAAQSATWTFVDGDWYEGNVALIGPRSHAMWLGSSVFDGGRWFESVAPDLDRHSARVNASAAQSTRLPSTRETYNSTRNSATARRYVARAAGDIPETSNP